MTAREADRRADHERARAEARRVFDRPLVLEAGAGTGKTTVLVERIVVWCLGPGWERAEGALREAGRPSGPEDVAARTLERVVAITFTEAAAAEMEERVGTALRLLARDGAEEWPRGLPREAVPEPPALRVARARALLFAFDRLRVSTIHAFCRRLLAEHPFEAGVHPRFEVDAAGTARAAVARAVVEERLRASAAEPDPDLEDLLQRDVAAPELEEMLLALLGASIAAEEFAADPLDPRRIRAFAERLRGRLEAFARAESGALDGIGKASEVARVLRDTSVRLGAEPPATPRELAERIEGLRSAWEDLHERLAKWAKDDFGAKERAALGARSGDVAAAAGPLDLALGHAMRLDPELLARAHRVLADLLARAELRLRAEGAESFDALLRRAGDLLRRHPEVAARARARIDQLLVDEFQDTDSLQCEIVRALALSGPPAQRPGLFVVGDPKQSIYGWRNADLRAYDDFATRVLAEPGASRHYLAVNRRSVPAVLAEVEQTLSRVFREERGVQAAYEPLVADEARAAAAARARGPAVEYWLSIEWDAGSGAAKRTSAARATELEARRLAGDLVRLRRDEGIAWRDVGILLRSTGDLDTYLDALRRAGVPYAVARERAFYRRREVLEAGALVRAVLDPNDQVALVAALRSAWAGVPDAAWRPLWAGGFPQAAREALEGIEGWRSRLRVIARAAAGEVRDLAIPGLAALEGWEQGLLHALDVMVALRRSFETEPCGRFVERLRTLPTLEAVEGARFLGAWRLANLERFFREIEGLLADGAGGAAGALRALRRDAERAPDWDEGRPQNPSGDAVQVMTIHGAKGLEFEHVYLLQLHKGRNPDAAPLRAESVGGALEWCLRIARSRTQVVTPGFDLVESRHNMVEEAEAVRTLYVAMTRARSRLVLAGCLDGRERRGSHAEILASRESRGEALARARAQVAASEDGVVEIDGVRFALLGRMRAPADAARSPAPRESVPDPERARADSERLRGARAHASARARRALCAAPSRNRAAELREAAAADPGEAGERGAQRAPTPIDVEVATAVGTVVHALLERFDWSAEPEAEWERQRADLEDRLARRIAPALLARARARAQEILSKLVRGPLWSRLRAIEPQVAARELPVLVRPAVDGEEAGPTGAWIGTIDLLYRDPDGGDWVVVDFKTDRVEGEADLAERRERYRAQGSIYARAVEALGLPRRPRVEFWFLDAGRVERIDP